MKTSESKKNKWLLKRAIFLIAFVSSIIAIYKIIPRKEFPVKVGQTWEREMVVEPYINNRPTKEVLVTYYDRIYTIDDDGKIFFIRNEYDSLDLNLDAFLFNCSLNK